jgi:hypothetical protein
VKRQLPQLAFVDYRSKRGVAKQSHNAIGCSGFADDHDENSSSQGPEIANENNGIEQQQDFRRCLSI